MPMFRVTVVSRTTKAINYHHRTGSTQDRLPRHRADAGRARRSQSREPDGLHQDRDAAGKMTPPAQFGPEYMTYVLWAITPEGRATRISARSCSRAITPNLLSTTDLQSFGLIVTAEPYFAVTQPSDVVVAENFVRNDTTGTIQQVDAKFELLQRGQYMYRPQEVHTDPPEPERSAAIGRGGKRGRDRAPRRRREVRGRHLREGRQQPARMRTTS